MADLHTELHRPTVAQEVTDRTAQREKLRQFFTVHPDTVFAQTVLADACGVALGSIRTRLGELKRGECGPVMNLHSHSGSWRDEQNVYHAGPKRWEFVTRLGRDASEPSPDRWSMPGAPLGAEPFHLTSPESR